VSSSVRSVVVYIFIVVATYTAHNAFLSYLCLFYTVCHVPVKDQSINQSINRSIKISIYLSIYPRVGLPFHCRLPVLTGLPSQIESLC